jgi:hypothetical protein
MIVTEDHGTISAHIIDSLIAVHVPESAAFGFFYEAGAFPTLQQRRGLVSRNASGDYFPGPLKQDLRFFKTWHLSPHFVAVFKEFFDFSCSTPSNPSGYALGRTRPAPLFLSPD